MGKAESDYKNMRMWRYKVLQLLVFLSTLAVSSTFELFRSRIAIDYGPRIIGVAYGLGGNLKTLGTIANKGGNLTLLAEQVYTIAKRQSAIEIIVGLPLDSNGKMSYAIKNFNGNLCLNFSSVLATVIQNRADRIKVVLVDERYTTREAKARMLMENIRDSIDAVSAMCLLERYRLIFHTKLTSSTTVHLLIKFISQRS